MKNLFKINILFVLLLLANIAGAKDLVEKEKKISKVYTGITTEKLSLNNKYGKIQVNAWQKNEITVDITIIARKKTEEAAIKLLEGIKIRIDENAASKLISFETQIPDHINNRNDENFEINYVVNMPESNPLDISNKFGSILMSDFKGKLDVKCAYGSLEAGRLENEEMNLKVSFGSADIQHIKKAQMDISYSKLTLQSSDNLVLISNYTGVKIGNSGTLNITNKYGNVNLSSVDRLIGTLSYSGMEIGRLLKSIDMETKYTSNFKVEEISNSFEQIKISTSYGNVNLDFSDNVSADFDIMLSYGNFVTDRGAIKYNEKIRENSSSSYKGNFGNANSASRINITGSYSNVKIN